MKPSSRAAGVAAPRARPTARLIVIGIAAALVATLLGGAQRTAAARRRG